MILYIFKSIRKDFAILVVTSGLSFVPFTPAVSEFIETIFDQLKDGKNELTLGFSEAMTKANPEDLKAAFKRLILIRIRK